MTGNNTDQPPTDTGPTPENAFALVGNELRAEIIQVLGDAHAHESSPNGVSFSELRSLTDTDPDPGQLNYHLQQLVGHFVKKRDGGYALRSEGLNLYLALQAGVFDRREERLTVDTGFDCYYCQTPVKATFSRGRATVECLNCEYRYLTKNTTPPLGTFEDDGAVFEQFSKHIHHTVLGYARGICQTCGNALGTEFVPPEEVYDSGLERSKVYVRQSCGHCGDSFFLFVGVALLPDPGLITFCYNHGVDVLSTPYWELEFAATDKHVTVRSTDPWEVALQVRYDGDTLELVVDGDLNVVQRTRFGGTGDEGTSLLSSTQTGVNPPGSRKSVNEVVLPDKEDCLRELRHHRWPDGVACPHCESPDTVKMGVTSKGAQKHRCHNCDSIFNDLTETIFAGHRLSLSEMFHIIREMEEKQTTQIARQLDRSYKSVLGFVHKVQDSRDEDAEFDLFSVCDVNEGYMTANENGIE